ncbi:uncharacterized protein TNCV_1162201 [Trichonephila clavipes]|nr:uncharacterized protein TNCV_1162201 [Trichonephila clavipes]
MDITSHTKCNTKKGQRYHNEIYLANLMVYKDQIDSSEVWMIIKSVVSAAAIMGCNHCHTPRHRIKEALDVSLGYGYNSPRGFHILPKLICCSSGW